MPYKDKEKQKQAKHESYLRNKKKVAESQKEKRDKTRFHIQKRKVESGCVKCGEDHVAVLVFHHRNPDEKEGDSTKMINDKWLPERIDEEISKCDVLCANCHMKLHWSLDHPENPNGNFTKVIMREGKGGVGNKKNNWKIKKHKLPSSSSIGRASP